MSEPAARPKLDLRKPEQAISLFDAAREASLNNTHRRGALIQLPARGRVIVSGDLHDHRLNLNKMVALARLEASPDHHLIVHEIVHGNRLINGRDVSVLTLLRVAQLKRDFPDQVHVLQANHDLGQVQGEQLVKGSFNVTRAFNEGLDHLYGSEMNRVHEAMQRFIETLPLAVRLPMGVMVSHSLPGPKRVADFDTSILDRLPTEAELRPGGSAYEMVWGRGHTAQSAGKLAEAWGVQLFVVGHEPITEGHQVAADGRVLILASDIDAGACLDLDLSAAYPDADALLAASIALHSFD